MLALSGTPVVNRPGELIAQLRILGRLGDFGSGAEFGARFRGPDAHQRLHWHLRARCFVRRLKARRAAAAAGQDARGRAGRARQRAPSTDSPSAIWSRGCSSQPLDLRELDAKVAAALRAERLVRLNALKLLAARGKLAAALAWIHDFRSSGERLVVFARHREIQRAVRRALPRRAAHPRRGQPRRAATQALRAFQAPDGPGNQLIVCSIEVAGQGLTLTRASNVAFLELDWTPAKHDQAEDRCHRIGQQDAVNAYYLLAAGTIDETIATLLERKRARDRSRHRRPRGGRGGRASTRSCASCAARPTGTCAPSPETDGPARTSAPAGRARWFRRAVATQCARLLFHARRRQAGPGPRGAPRGSAPARS